MGYFSRIWMAASVAVARDHNELGAKSFRLLPAGLIPATGFGVNRVLGGEMTRTQAEDSVRQAMYISCWGPS